MLPQSIERFSLLSALMLLTTTLMAGDAKESYRPPTLTLGRAGDISYLSSPKAGTPLEVARYYLQLHRDELGLTEQDLHTATVTSQFTSEESGVTHIYMAQQVNGLKVSGCTIGIHVTQDGRVIKVHSSFLGDAHNKLKGSVLQSPQNALGSAVRQLGYTVSETFRVISQNNDARRETVFSSGGFATGNIPVYLELQPISADEIRPVWVLDIQEKEGVHIWQVSIDAETGHTLNQWDAVIVDSFHGKPDMSRNQPLMQADKQHKARTGEQYEVFPMPYEYPYDGSRVIVEDPAHPLASPYGWHDTDGVPGAEYTTTRGNNTHTYLDRNNDSIPDSGSDVDGGASLNFTGDLVPLNLSQDPVAYANASIVNLFYWVNVIHDVTYGYGFNEAAGNFQVNNYGNGGLGNDEILAWAQKGADAGYFDNAYFGTRPDGTQSYMGMLLWRYVAPYRDSSLSNAIIAHEYGHGISIRLTGGAANTNCLSNSEQMGEGWSDFLGLVLTAKATDTPELPRSIGTYALGEPANGDGIRSRPYTTDMAINEYTYANLPNQYGPHAVGFVWATILWDVYWKLTEEHGFNPDFYGHWSTGGNNLAIQLVLDGMKLQPCSPGFVDGRDAILQADMALTGGANQCLLWEAFARRGLGYSASQGSSSNTGDGVAAFDTPESCDTFSVASHLATCAGQDLTHTIQVGSIWNGPVTFSGQQLPEGLEVSFSPNPVSTYPAAISMTVTAANSMAHGIYTVNVLATDGTTSKEKHFQLTVYDRLPHSVSLGEPANETLDVNQKPTLTWSATDQVSHYRVELARDADFQHITMQSTVHGTQLSIDESLESLTRYHWRVIPVNACGDGASTEVFTFRTREQPDYFTEQFLTGHDMSYSSVTFEPHSHANGYVQCTQVVSEFPTDPSDGTPLNIILDSYAQISLTTPVILYGVPYQEIYVGSHGYITFTQGDITYIENLSQHFITPRISGWFDDLYPASNISYKLLDDRVTVTWLNIREYEEPNQNSFQIEMFYNGTIRITYLNMDASDGIIGLSAGNGLPADFIATDMSGCHLSQTCASAVEQGDELCGTFQVDYRTRMLCQNESSVFDILVGDAWSAPVTFTASDYPEDLEVSFSQSTVSEFPAEIQVFVFNPGTVEYGTYPITLTASDGVTTAQADIHMLIHPTPAAPTLLEPSDNAIVSLSPQFQWTSNERVRSSTLEVATDASFDNMVYTRTVTADTHVMAQRLSPLTQYYWRVHFRYPCDESVYSEVSRLRTPQETKHFAELFQGNLDLNNTSIMFETTDESNAYTICNEAATEFPTDPSDGTPLNLFDDNFAAILLNQPVYFYGETYDYLYLGSNGYITFNTGDNIFSESLDIHFNKPRISAWFDDLNPSQGGTVSYKQLDDRIAITFQGVPEYSTSNSNNFQIELFFDGYIRLTYLHMDSQDAVVGLSQGLGIPTILHTDLTECYQPTSCPADLDNNGWIDPDDRDLMRDFWSQPGIGDIDNDGFLNILDMILIDQHIGPCTL